MFRFAYLLSTISIVLIISCTEEEPIQPSETAEEITPSTPTTSSLSFEEGDSDYIFDQSKLHTFELDLPAELLAKMDADPTAEEYVEGNLIFEGQTVTPVGIRYKGSIGAFVNCLSGTNWARPSGFKTCTKLSMKIKINWEDKDQRFYGLKKLQFHSQNNDESQMRDRLGYWLFREMGVPAPRSVHARLVINGVYVGLFALVEQIDGRFTRYNYEDGKGNLYKEIWPLRDNGQPFLDSDYLEALKTNEDENPTVEMIRTFAQEVENTPFAELQPVIDKWMDIEEIISYAVVDRMIRNDDGAFHWYCDFGGCSSHNFYWYEEPSARTMHLIPWDLDNAFQNIISDANPVTPIPDAWGTTRNDCDPFSYGFLSIRQRSAACDKLVAGWASFTDEFEQRKIDFLNGPFAASTVNGLIDNWKAQIEAATLEANDLHQDAVTRQEWERGINELKDQLEFARNN